MKGGTPLHHSLFLTLGKLLLSPQSGVTSLQSAVENGHVDTVRALLEHKAQATEPKVRLYLGNFSQ